MTQQATSRVEEEKLQKAIMETEQAIDWMTKQKAKSGFDELQMKMNEVKKETEQSLRERILDATMDGIRKRNQTEEENFAKAMMGLRLKMELLGEQFKEVQAPTYDEKQQIETLKSVIKQYQGKIEELKHATFFKESRTQSAKANLNEAESRLKILERSIMEKVNDRIRKAKIDQSLQNFLQWTNKVEAIMSSRVKDLEKEIASVTKTRAELFTSKEQYARTLEEADKEIATVKADLTRAEEDLVPLENGSEEYVAAEKRISDLKDQIREAESRRNEALARYQENEKGLKRLQQHIEAQSGLRDNHKMWLAILEEVTKVNVVAFRSRLMAIKGAADQEVAKDLDKIGAKVAEEEMVEMASIIKASDEIMMDKIERTPEEVQRMHEILAASAEARAKIKQRMGAQIKEFMEKYGTDPLALSEETYMTN